MTMKKKVLTTLSVVLVLGMAAMGILAYLTSTDDDVNVMTLGNVQIEQNEYQRVQNDDGTYPTDTIDGQTSYVLEAFDQAKPLLPATESTNHGAGPWDPNATVRMTQVGSYGGMDVFTSKNAQDKFVTVTNTGKSDAYVRTLVAIEVGSTDGSLIGSSYHQNWTQNSVGTVAINGNNYNVYEYVYAGASDNSRHVNGVLPAGDTSYPNLAQVYLQSIATNEDMEAIDGNGNGMLDILVLSQAGQVAGFEEAGAETALDTMFGDVTEETAAAWFKGIANFEFVEAGEEKAQVMGEDAAEILASLEAGKNLIVDNDMDLLGFDANEVDAKGATVTLNGQGSEAYGYLAFLPDAGEDVTVSNLNVTGAGFVEVGDWSQGGGTYEVNNVKVENLASTLANGDKGFTLACAFCHYGNAVLNDCVMTGATAVQDGVMPVDLGCVNDTTTVINGGEYGTVYCWSHSVVTIDGADVDTLYVSPIKGTVTAKAGTHVDTINVDYGTSDLKTTKERLQKLIIEDGADVDTITFRGTEYTVEQWNAFVAAF